jgi:hypothetical protein
MTLISNRLTDIGLGAGITPNFKVQYEDSLPNQANIIRNANALLAIIENEYNVTTGWFNTPNGKFGTGNRQVVNLNRADGSGANNSGYGSAINLDPQGVNSNASDAAERVKMVFMNEWVEILMSLTNGKWNAGDSMGEGLSQYCGIIRFQTGHYSYYGSWVDQWLDTHPRQDWVDNTEGTDGNAISFGCALAFIYYLNTQLKFSINQIIAAGASNLATVYRTLTGDNGDPYPFFSALLEHAYPSSTNANIPGPVSDDPYPLAALSFWIDKNTFGKDEVQDVLTTQSGIWPKAFWLVIEGFSRNSFNALGITVSALTGSFTTLAGITITPNPDIDFENATNPQTPQRIRIPYDITFAHSALTDFPSSGSQIYDLNASLNFNGTHIRGSDASTQFELVAGADPYFTNIDPSQNNVFYLSQDLRIFTATPGQNSNPIPGAPAFTNDSINGAFSYIQQLLTWLNINYSNPNGTDPFNTILPGQGGALQGDSSVTPLTIDMSNIFNINIYNNYNFAVARVRLRGNTDPASAARNTRVFFRLWSTETVDTDYQTGSTFPSVLDAANLPVSPLVGTDHQTLPFFASGNLSNNTDYGTGGANNHDIQINTGDGIWAYYGCFLNLYDSSNLIDGRPVQQWLNGTHHCIVAQIAYDDAPIIPGASPETSDKLAQRNLQITLSDNPGPASTHRIPQTFDIRPSTDVVQSGYSFVYPDELMIDWGKIPPGSIASIYWPQVMASDVLALASKIYSTHTLSAIDAHTIQCKVTSGITYVPVPTGMGENFAGLFTVDLPTTVVTGQEFNIIVRRIGMRQSRRNNIRSPPSTTDEASKDKTPKAATQSEEIIFETAKAFVTSPPSTTDEASKDKTPKAATQSEEIIVKAAKSIVKSWRYVIGTFQVRIPVSKGQDILFSEENTLAIMKWRLQQMSQSNRWYPVLERYVSYIAARVDGMGGNSDKIAPSSNGITVKDLVKELEYEYTGKVCEVLFDCFGDFEGFTLRDCNKTHIFKVREHSIKDVVIRACKEQLLLSVYVEAKHENRICKLVIRC